MEVKAITVGLFLVGIVLVLIGKDTKRAGEQIMGIGLGLMLIGIGTMS